MGEIEQRVLAAADAARRHSEEQRVAAEAEAAGAAKAATGRAAAIAAHNRFVEEVIRLAGRTAAVLCAAGSPGIETVEVVEAWVEGRFRKRRVEGRTTWRGWQVLSWGPDYDVGGYGQASRTYLLDDATLLLGSWSGHVTLESSWHYYPGEIAVLQASIIQELPEAFGHLLGRHGVSLSTD